MPYFFPSATSTYDSNAVVNGGIATFGKIRVYFVESFLCLNVGFDIINVSVRHLKYRKGV